MPNLIKPLLFALVALNAFAQMPHEVLLLVNESSQASKRAANVYVETRGIPRRNVVYVQVPEHLYSGAATVTPEEFKWLIWEPANRVAKQRGIDQNILAWVYSVDFPIRVKTDPNDRRQMSVNGLTFTRNVVPGAELIEQGKYFSKLFAGPNERLNLTLNAMSFGPRKRGLDASVAIPEQTPWLRDGLGDAMPLPNMMLGYVGENGNDLETVLATIARGAASDHRGKREGVYFVVSDDVRSKCRAWQFGPAVQELKGRGVSASVTTNFPAGAKNVMGLMLGAEEVDPSRIGSFAPGAVADHLTSWSAEFQKPQTKLTEWLKAGATASAGAVVEPYSNPNKFPSARFFMMYASGCTVLESFYQSIASPLQLLLLGDPLAKPYAPPINLTLLGAERIEKDFTFVARLGTTIANREVEYAFLLDGVMVREPSANKTIEMKLNELSDGWHELRCVARVKHWVEFNTSVDKSFVVNKTGRSVSISPNVERLGKYEHGIHVEITGAEKPKSIRLMSGARLLDEKPYDPEEILVLDELTLGGGPNRMRVVAVYADGMEVSSPPVNFGVKFAAES